MDGNKDAARHCLGIGMSALRVGEKEKALKFLAKAQRLEPSLLLDSIISKLREELKDSTSCCQGQTKIKQSNSETGRADIHSTSNVVASADQVEIVQRICNTKDYYEILGLKKDCTGEEIRKAYRKISLKVHPDKNSASGAEDAFKHVSKAFACLNNESARVKYDRYGPEDSHKLAHHSNTHQSYEYSGFAYDTFDADDIFNSFFFGSESAFSHAQYLRKYKSTAGRMRRAPVNHKSESLGGLMTFLQILPVLALFLISLLPLSKPIYSMEQVAPYKFPHSTREHEVPFYVKSMDFEREYPPGSFSRRRLEANVEKNMVEILAYNCRRELNFRRWNPSLQTPNCDKLQGFYV